jgi:predicted transcriptional regulator
LILACVALPVFEEPDEDDIEAWLAESEAGDSVARSKDLIRAICGFEE